MGQSSHREHKEEGQKVETKIAALLLKFERVLKEELSTSINPEEFIELASSLEVIIDLRKKLESAKVP